MFSINTLSCTHRFPLTAVSLYWLPAPGSFHLDKPSFHCVWETLESSSWSPQPPSQSRRRRLFSHSAPPHAGLHTHTDSPAGTKCFLLRPARYSPEDMASLFSLPGTQPGNSSSTCALQGRHVLHPVCCRCSVPSLPAGVPYCPPNLSLGSLEA